MTKGAEIRGRVLVGDGPPAGQWNWGIYMYYERWVIRMSEGGDGNSEGTFRATGLSSGTYAVHARAIGTQMALTEPIVVDAGATISDVVLQLNPTATISGRVLDQAGKGVPAAWTEATLPESELRDVDHDRLFDEDANSAWTRTDVQGRYTLQVLPGRYKLNAFVAVGVAGSQTVRASHERVHWQDVVLSAPAP